MSRAQELLLDLLRRGAPAPAALTGGVTGEDCTGLLAAAPRGLHPYLAWRLQQLVDNVRIPAEVRYQLEAARRGAAIGHILRQGLLGRTAEALDRAGVPFVVLKGMALAHLAYPEPSLRPMGDLDLWTRPEFLEAGASALLDAGLRYPPVQAARNPAARRADEMSTRMLELPMTGGGLVLEFHGVVQSMASVAPAWADEAWRRTVPVSLGGVKARVLHPEDMLTHLAIHCSAHHRFALGLGPLLDLALWLEAAGPHLDWKRMAERWNREGGAAWITLTLALTREMLGASIPAEFCGDTTTPGGFAALYQLARDQVLEAHRPLPPTLAKVSAEPSFAARARWLAYRLTGWYWQGPPGTRRTASEATAEAFRRMAHDLRFKLPPYVRGWVSGSLRGRELQQRQELAVGRERMAEMVRELEGQGGRGAVTR